MPVQLYGVVRCDFDLVHVHVFVVQGKMMMRFGSQRITVATCAKIAKERPHIVSDNSLFAFTKVFP